MSTLHEFIRHVINEQLDDDERLDVEPFDQTRGLCGPASLKMVMEFYGDERTEDENARACDATKGDGTDVDGMIKGANEFGYSVEVVDDAGIVDLERLVMDEETPVIVDWFSTDDGHYSVVVGVDSKRGKIKIQDPEIRRQRTYDFDEFKRIWFDYEGTDPSEGEFFVGRMIVVKPR